MNGQELSLRHDLFYDDALIFDQVEAKAATLLGPMGYGVQVEYQDMANLLVWSAENDAPFVALEHGAAFLIVRTRTAPWNTVGA
mgnify:FL=1